MVNNIKIIIKKIFLINFFLKDYINFKILNSKSNREFKLKWQDKLACLYDKTSYTNFDTHYIYHTAWAARILEKTKPNEHIDISSSLYFSSIVSAFLPIKFYDYRPVNLNLKNFSSFFADLLLLPFDDLSVESISCMHVLEHIGLGRYGDQLDPIGDIKGAKELERVLSKGGQLLFVVPVSGKPHIQFNAHRIYSFDMIINMFSNLKLIEFSLIPDNAKSIGIIVNATKEQANEQKYGCGCFHFIKE